MKVTHAVDDKGCVYCIAQRKSVDVLGCYGCERVIDIDLDSRRPKVTCDMERNERQEPPAG